MVDLCGAFPGDGVSVGDDIKVGHHVENAYSF